ncbi:zinc finger protein 532-like [Ostrinia furnacalis]|uniref:zinc finger protein 532-like n=1 Tax=Ostrinia furnacalis TaxID=93504 RepID=UPI0010399A2D|nr:zinc finger protein 532-like [Ostrinia furnacalis]XP_028164331.1 zinc finger protein 532-like [Ostrinia furnacalis]XP_028164332.1 zinc finger protein 532-like [Ostrinia furnacalis]XP_028164333.1 zinc finger protein 532-like [Ostrinia furnacalis]
MEGSSTDQSCEALAEEASKKYSIKNLLFYRAIPNYQIPVNTNGYNVYSCKDCGDGFLLESSYRNHIQRKSVLINYQCRICVSSRRHLIFYNRCNLLSHIRSHTVKTATINVSDLSVDPLPSNFFKTKKNNTNPPMPPAVQITSAPSDKSQTDNQMKKISQSGTICSDCGQNITMTTGVLYKDRASHYMQYTNQVYSCPICLFNLPTACGLKAHLRLHLKKPPFICPECGIGLNNKSVIYPYNHGCEGFNMMRATARCQCPAEKCKIFHPNYFKNHMTANHFKVIYKCSSCAVACFSESTIIKHAVSQKHDISPNRFYQCDLCPGRLVMVNQTNRHIKSHNQTTIYPCWTKTCMNIHFKTVNDLIIHYIDRHCQNNCELRRLLLSSLPPEEGSLQQDTRMYRILKRCDQCMRSFTYKCQYGVINALPNTCPFKCVAGAKSSSNKVTIRCPLCSMNIDQSWEVIKDHFALHHQEHRCLDAKISITKLSNAKISATLNKKHPVGNKNKVINRAINKRSTRRARRKAPKSRIDVGTIILNEITGRSNNYVCGKCQHESETKELLEKHILTHRDQCMAYQCMECGECFVVKQSFSTHLLLNHAIFNVEEYINKKKCFNENALTKCVKTVVEEPLKENQCKICREQFECSEDLEKHFRTHGMAFLIKNSSSKSNS